MKTWVLAAGIAAGCALGLTAARASTTVITFDEFPATNNNHALTTAYAGIVFGGDNAGTWGGLSQGDPGTWGLQGTNGPQFLGFNGSGPTGGYSDSVTFAAPVAGVRFDASLSNGSVNGTITLDAFDGALLVVSASAILGPINTWSTLSVTHSGITRIVISETDTGLHPDPGFHPFGIDNLVLSSSVRSSGVPEPSTWAMVLLGFAGLALASWRARTQASVIA
jgi:hypothetical protein